ncbi:MAG TPA: hypothetical protein VNN76_12845 [Bacteroidota bacterium]|nr:hypothetical protein [Bacteroidota bacterium]
MGEVEKNKEKEQEKLGSGLKKAGLILLFIFIAVLAYDGYSNKWKYVKMVLYRNSLELRSLEGRVVELKADRDFKLVEIPDSALTLSEDIVQKLDEMYRDSGEYRIYFRLSDAQSDRLEKLYQTLAMVDTGESVKKTVGDVQTAYQNLKRALGLDTTRAADTIRVLVPDSTGKLSETKIVSGGEGDFFRALGRSVANNPQILIGIGIGLAASAGFDLLGGQVFVAWSPEGRFGVDALVLGARAGKWEGRDIDILWVYGSKPDTLQTRAEEDSLSVQQ